MGRVGKLSKTLSYGSRLKLSKTLSYGSRLKLSKTLFYGSRWKTQQNAFLWVALENSAKRFPMGRVLDLELY
ncbi:hypothetical protein [Leptospira interrogans]|uniref:Uncharacterized protein n=1 Tax=Leptospira interrogans serovar Bataviae TaxID=312175 RepID=A0AAP9WK85_LEPIR|nr:hypothetical protein [Leptospira interrogans]QOI49812.1 hypothetical protein Lepto1489_04575 [Leptospira interrogans serovar Bataviae]